MSLQRRALCISDKKKSGNNSSDNLILSLQEHVYLL